MLAALEPSPLPTKAANHEGWIVVARDGFAVRQARDASTSSPLTMSSRLCSLQRLFDWDPDATDALLESRIVVSGIKGTTATISSQRRQRARQHRHEHDGAR